MNESKYKPKYEFSIGEDYPQEGDHTAIAGIHAIYDKSGEHGNSIEIKVNVGDWNDEKALIKAKDLRNFVLNRITSMTTTSIPPHKLSTGYCSRCIREKAIDLSVKENEIYDLSGLITRDQYKNGLLVQVHCIDCGVIYVNHRGDYIQDI